MLIFDALMSSCLSCRVVDGIEDNEHAFHFNVEHSEPSPNTEVKGEVDSPLILD